MECYLVTTLLLLVALIHVVSCSTCDLFAIPYMPYLGTMTPYRFLANTNNNPLHYTGCEAKKSWAMLRHGTRYPGLDVVAMMNTRLPIIRDMILQNQDLLARSGHLRHSVLDGLRKWTVDMSESRNGKLLVEEGKEEMLTLSERMRLRFPDLFPIDYSNTSYYFKFTEYRRTEESAKSFAAGLFGEDKVGNIWFPEPVQHDIVTMFDWLCVKWAQLNGQKIINNLEIVKEKIKFQNSNHMTSAMDSVNRALNLTDGLSLGDLLLIHKTCAFETAWNRKRESPWCSILTHDAFKAIAFLKDLSSFYKEGHGNRMTHKQACFAINDIVQFFENPSEYPKSKIHFSHAAILLRLIAHLGLYKDEPLLTESNFENYEDYAWKIGKLCPFAANLQFVLYDCRGTLKVLTLHQEKPIQLPWCDDDQDLCDLEVIKQNYVNNFDCSLDKICTTE